MKQQFLTSTKGTGFESQSPINREKLTGQNGRLFDYLAAGNTIHCLDLPMIGLQIGYLNSRISDLVNKHGVVIHKRFINVGGTTVREYSLRSFEN